MNRLIRKVMTAADDAKGPGDEGMQAETPSRRPANFASTQFANLTKVGTTYFAEIA